MKYKKGNLDIVLFALKYTCFVNFIVRKEIDGTGQRQTNEIMSNSVTRVFVIAMGIDGRVLGMNFLRIFFGFMGVKFIIFYFGNNKFICYFNVFGIKFLRIL